MRNILDSFNSLHIVLRIGIIAVAVALIALLGTKLLGGSDDPLDEQADPNANVASETTETTTPEPTESTDDQTASTETAPEDTTTIEDEFAEIDQDPALSLPGEQTDAETEEPSDDPSIDGLIDENGDPITTPSVIGEEEPEDADAVVDTKEANVADTIKGEQEDYIQELWDELNWIPVQLNTVMDPNNISVSLYTGDREAQSIYGTDQLSLSLASIDIPSDMTQQAADRIQEFLTDAEVLVIEQDPATDSNTRVHIHADFVNVQEVLLEEGLAKVSDRDGNTKYLDSFKEYEQSAKDDKLGLWK